MWNKRKQLVALTAVAGVLTVSATGVFAQSISPFGKGNPIQALSEQLDSLEKRIGKLESPPIPTSLSGTYSVTTTGFCVETQGIGSTWFPMTDTRWKTTGDNKMRWFTSLTTEKYVKTSRGKGTASNTSDGISYTAFGRTLTDTSQSLLLTSDICNSTYTMNKDTDGKFDGTFEKETTACEGQWKGTFKLHGSALNGGNTLVLISTISSPSDVETSGNNSRICVRTQTARKISD